MSKNKLTIRQQVFKWYKEDSVNKITYDEKEFSDLFESVMRIKTLDRPTLTLRQAYCLAYMNFDFKWR